MEAWFGPARVSNEGSRRSGGGAHPLNESRISNARESAWYASPGSKCGLSTVSTRQVAPCDSEGLRLDSLLALLMLLI